MNGAFFLSLLDGMIVWGCDDEGDDNDDDDADDIHTVWYTWMN